MDNPGIEAALQMLDDVLSNAHGNTAAGGSDGDNVVIDEALGILRSVVNIGVSFKGYPVLLGPRKVDGHKPDKLVLTRLDRFLRKHFPSLSFLIADGQTFVDGATPPPEEL